MRQIFFDTETTGLSPKEGHRIVEIAAVETVDGVATGREFHRLLNPDRDVPEDSTKVHGHTLESLRSQPRFRDIAEDLLAFIRGAEMLAHNSPFDEGFLNAELERINYPQTIWEVASFTDTMALARRLNPAQRKLSLDHLLDVYGVDRSMRQIHTAILDSRLLMQLYLKFGEQHDLSRPSLEVDVPRAPIVYLTNPPVLRVQQVSEQDLALHAAYLDGLEAENKCPPLARQIASRSPRP